MKTIYDAAYPPAIEPKVDGVGFYIGGNTPHVWTPQEIEATKVRYRLPIFTRSDFGNAVTDGNDARNALTSIKAPPGIAVALDLETKVDPAYVNQFKITLHGYYVLSYGSLSSIMKNPSPWWIADWDGIAAIDNDDPMGAVGIQYGGHPTYDLSIFTDVVPFWDTSVAPIHLLKEGTVISFSDQNGNPCIAGKDSSNGNLLSFTLMGGKWSVVDVTLQIKNEVPADPRTYKVD